MSRISFYYVRNKVF